MADETSNRTPHPEDAAEGEWPGKRGPGETSDRTGSSAAGNDEDAAGSDSREENGSGGEKSNDE